MHQELCSTGKTRLLTLANLQDESPCPLQALHPEAHQGWTFEYRADPAVCDVGPRWYGDVHLFVHFDNQEEIAARTTSCRQHGLISYAYPDSVLVEGASCGARYQCITDDESIRHRVPASRRELVCNVILRQDA